MIVFLLLLFSPPKLLNKHPNLLFLHTVSRAVLHGHLDGQHIKHSNSVDFSGNAEPGDIILCHNEGSGYGYWTHSAIYIGNNQAVDSEDFANGTQIVHVKKYREYDRVAIFRGGVSDVIGQQIAKSAIYKAGKPYDPFSSLTDRQSEYCSKLIWQVYKANGIDINTLKSWILPDDIADSRKLHMIVSWDAK